MPHPLARLSWQSAHTNVHTHPAPSLYERTCREDFTVARDRLLNGLDKLNQTNALVDTMKAELAELQPTLEAKSRATAELLGTVSAEQADAEEVQRNVAAEEADVKKMQEEIQVWATRGLWGGGGATQRPRRQRRPRKDASRICPVRLCWYVWNQEVYVGDAPWGCTRYSS
eukprot:149520-Chlamydomonas_euryale.AAC.1